MKQLEIKHKFGTIWLGTLPETYSYAAENTLAHMVQQTPPSEIEGERWYITYRDNMGYQHRLSVNYHPPTGQFGNVNVQVMIHSQGMTSLIAPTERKEVYAIKR